MQKKEMDKSSTEKTLDRPNERTDEAISVSLTKTGTNGDSRKVMDARRRIQNFIFLRAWRNQKEKNNNLEKSNKNLARQVENLQMQIYSLKQLLDAEKTRVLNTNSDLRKVLNGLEDYKYEKMSLNNEKEQLQHRLQLMEEQMKSMENECKNRKNEIFTARLEAQNWEKQLEKEREKLNRLKDEKKFLIEEVRFKGNLLVWQVRSFEQFSRLYNILQGKPNNPALPWDDAVGRNDHQISEIPKLFRASRKQQTLVIIEKPLEIPEPKVVLAKVERKMEDEEDETTELEKPILEKTWVMLKNY